jgi:hypothetical protein
MLVADADLPFLEVLWSILIFFALAIWLWIAFTVLIDVFRRHDIGGWARRRGPCSSSCCRSSGFSST